MIRVQKYPPPAHYEALVKNPGLRYLARYSHPTPTQFASHKYWNEIHRDIYILYKGICAYCASWTPRSPSHGPDHTSIDHFIPKAKDPSQAYEWDNFRLCRARLNHHKSDYMDVIDPFFIQNGWFIIDFSTFLIKPEMSTPPWIQDRVQSTISRLELNGDDYVDERIMIITLYVFDKITLRQLTSKYPFIAEEFIRQNFDIRFKKRMQAVLRRP